MDRKSWLWRRKSSERNPSGETESSGSVSSLSGRFSDDQILSNLNSQSPEVTSKAADDDGHNDTVMSLSKKLSEALANVHEKEDLVKQHAKVAEEAVSGWERSENEVMVLKKQVEGLTQKNSNLEERVGHLDGALKECLRQLRQAREEQEEKIFDALVKKSSEWESKKSQLENQLVELQSQLQNAKSDSTNTVLHGVQSKLELVEKENSSLKLKLQSISEELELMICERDLSTRAAESASKQRLDSLRKVSKLEAECRRLKAVAQKQTLMHDQLSVTASSVYAESVTDCQSDSGEKMLLLENDIRKNRATHERNCVVPSTEIDLMDDFLEMESLAACPKPRSERNVSTWVNGQSGELEAMMNRTAELEEKLKMMETEKVKLETTLNECQTRLNASEDQLKQTQTKLVELNTELVQANEAKRAAEKEAETMKEDQLKPIQTKLVELRNELAHANEAKRAAEKEAESMKVKLKNSAKRLDEAESKMVKIQHQLTNANEAKNTVEVELKNANVKKREAELKLKEMGLELRITRSSIHTLEQAVDKERNFSRETLLKCEKLDAEMSKMKLNSQVQRSAIVDEFRINQDKDLAVAASKFAECQKTIASLGRQLKSLATFDDLLISSERPADEVL